MYLGQVERGDIWKTRGRKGALIIRFLEPVDFSKDTFFQAEIIEGRAKFASWAYREAQSEDGVGTEGTALTFRTTTMSLDEFVGRDNGPDPELNVTGRIMS